MKAINKYKHIDDQNVVYSGTKFFPSEKQFQIDEYSLSYKHIRDKEKEKGKIMGLDKKVIEEDLTKGDDKITINRQMERR